MDEWIGGVNVRQKVREEHESVSKGLIYPNVHHELGCKGAFKNNHCFFLHIVADYDERRWQIQEKCNNS